MCYPTDQAKLGHICKRFHLIILWAFEVISLGKHPRVILVSFVDIDAALKAAIFPDDAQVGPLLDRGLNKWLAIHYGSSAI